MNAEFGSMVACQSIVPHKWCKKIWLSTSFADQVEGKYPTICPGKVTWTLFRYYTLSCYSFNSANQRFHIFLVSTVQMPMRSFYAGFPCNSGQQKPLNISGLFARTSSRFGWILSVHLVFIPSEFYFAACKFVSRSNGAQWIMQIDHIFVFSCTLETNVVNLCTFDRLYFCCTVKFRSFWFSPDPDAYDTGLC